MSQAEIEIVGMHCDGCVASVEKALKRLDGVSDATADLDGGRARVDFDPALVDLSRMRQAIEDAGFDVPA